MRKLVIFLIFCTLGCSYNREKSLIGNWKTIKVTFHDLFNKKSLIVYDRNNTDSVKRTILNDYMLNSESSANDSIAFSQQLDRSFEKYKTSKVIFETDSSFFMESFGLIIPKAEPGWNFGDSLTGKWSTNNYETLKLDFGNIALSHPFYFKVSKLTYDSLNMSMTTEDYQNPYIEIEFTRQ